MAMRRTISVGLALLAGTWALSAAQATGEVRTPSWVEGAVFYQIFPERFRNGERKNDPPGTRPWGSEPTIDNYMGGDLQGVIASLPYLRELGITALYFNPIFTSNSNHKYHTIDFMHVDPAFGGDAAFRQLLRAAHGMGIKVILDGVFNHTGTRHPFFQDAVKRGPASPYWKWYNIWGYPVVQTPKPNYEAWWGLADLPELQVASNSQVADYIFQVEEHWLKEGIDGWRLDVPNEIDSDAFWQEFRRRAKAINPEAYIVGEIWVPAHRWLQGDQFDAVMNYEWRERMVKFFAKNELGVAAFDDELAQLRRTYDPAVTRAMFNLLDSHDTVRFLTDAGGDASRLKLAVLFQMTYLGAPVIYYGDEVGMQGGKDPDDRRCFPWDAAQQDRTLHAYYRKLIALRKAHPALAGGSYQTLARDPQANTLAYLRQDSREAWVVVLNNSAEIRTLTIPLAGAFPAGSMLRDALGGKQVRVENGQVVVKLDPRQGMVLGR